MRRTALAFTVTVAVLLPLATAASAVGPGGWDHLGVGLTASAVSLNGAVYSLNADDPGGLLVGGNFTAAGGVAHADRIAIWNGTTWGALKGTPISNGSVNAIAYHAGKIYAGGTFVNAGGKPNADFLAVWNGAGWAPFCNAVGPAFNGNVMALQIIGNTLYVGGTFVNGAGITAADDLLACDLTTGAASSTVPHDGDMSGAVLALTADSNGTLYAGGQFSNLTGLAAADYIAAYHAGTWHAMGSGAGVGGGAVDSYVRSLAAHGTNVYVGTDSVDVAGISKADHVVRWNGSAWSALGSNTAGTNGWFTTSGNFADIYALATYGSLVFAAGNFQNANGIATADSMAYFDGTTWRPLGSSGAGGGPLNATATALAMFRGKVHVSGNFTSAGGDALAHSVASYSLTQPDVRIGRAASGPFAGNAVFSTTGVGESQTAAVARSSSATFYVDIQNDGLVPAMYTLRSLGSAAGFSVHYFRGTADRTAAVLAGTYSTGVIPARSSITMRMVVTRGATSAASVTYVVRASSAAGTSPDAVKAIVTAK